MKKIMRMSLVAMLILMTISIFSVKANAMTANELKDYICNEKGINGTNLVIRDADRVKVEKFFANNEITDEQAGKIKSIIDKGITLMNEDGATTPNELSTKAKKEQLLSYGQEAAAVLGMTISYDASEERLDIYKDGVLYDSLNWGITEAKAGTTEASLVQTGSTNYRYIIVAGIVLIAGIMLVISRKKILSAEAAR